MKERFESYMLGQSNGAEGDFVWYQHAIYLFDRYITACPRLTVHLFTRDNDHRPIIRLVFTKPSQSTEEVPRQPATSTT